MLGILFATALAATAPQDQSAASAQAEPTRLADIEVRGRPLQSMIQNFVDEVALPHNNRALARWDSEVCVGVANLRPAPSEYLIDRISTIARDVGLTVGNPGCTANILIIATVDSNGLADRMVSNRRKTFITGSAGTDRGNRALRNFRETLRPVRWWQSALPIDSITGERAVRISGDCGSSCAGNANESTSGQYAPNIKIWGAARLQNQIVDNLTKSIVIVDVDLIQDISITQLADYIAMVTLAQIDPQADTSRYSSVLNVFSQNNNADGITDWDTAYLRGLYASNRGSTVSRGNRTEIFNSIRREHARLTESASSNDQP